ncbi:homeobox-leucine zipper protein ATHB-52-like [Solanum dulcamara]|uniref:homeobox-leucine zipper protein ATHB-52-like n=1 Tax=Solanum dulcamara TaxID=45834 RepID=UPI0024853184|nr:homeobox-leucine zipper protein ATHB-52-like [Solanum dulcamara]
MDFLNSQLTRKNHLKCHKKRLNQDQVRLLEISFCSNNKLDSDRKSQLAQELGLPPRQVAIWYQNKRARWKSQSLEVDYNSLQKRLDSALDDNEKLKLEVERLRKELNKTQEMLLGFSTTTNYSSISSSCDEVGSTSCLQLHDHQSKHNHLDKELYACLIGEEGQFGTHNGHNFFASSLS